MTKVGIFCVDALRRICIFYSYAIYTYEVFVYEKITDLS